MWDINAVTGSNDTNVTMNLAFRAGPFDIQRGGGGLEFFLVTSY